MRHKNQSSQIFISSNMTSARRRANNASKPYFPLNRRKNDGERNETNQNSKISIETRNPRKSEEFLSLLGAPDHGREDKMGDLSAGLEDFDDLNNSQSKDSGWVRMLKTPPNSPQLNLCEYYNRTLRMRSNQLRHNPEFAKHFLDDVPHGQKMQHKVNALKMVLDRALEWLKNQRCHQGCLARIMEFHEQVIRDDGCLDMKLPM